MIHRIEFLTAARYRRNLTPPPSGGCPSPSSERGGSHPAGVAEGVRFPRQVASVFVGVR
jgi:hypothetical protein